MRLRLTILGLLLLSAYAPSRLSAQLNLGLHNTGLSIGNSREWNGVRINFRDSHVGRVRGVNLTLWTPADYGFWTREVDGLAVGVSPAARYLNGVGVGLVAVVGGAQLRGVHVGGLAVVSNGDIRGIGFGSLALVANHDLAGINASLLASVANGNATGITIGGLAVVANQDAKGVFVGGLAAVANGDAKGFLFGGLATVANGTFTGIGGSLLANVAGDMHGISVAGLAVVAADEIRGLGLSLGRTDSERMTGLVTGAYNRVRGEQRGVSIGIYNKARVLHGLQVGVLNHAGNARGIFRWMPLLSFHH